MVLITILSKNSAANVVHRDESKLKFLEKIYGNFQSAGWIKLVQKLRDKMRVVKRRDGDYIRRTITPSIAIR